MRKKTTLTKKQLSVIEEMFAGETDIEAVLTKHNVSQRQYNKWLADENFEAEFIRRIEWLNLQSQALIASYTSLATVRLVELTNSDKPETRRKACLDIISLPKLSPKKPDSSSENNGNEQQIEPLSPKAAGRLLQILANEKNLDKIPN